MPAWPTCGTVVPTHANNCVSHKNDAHNGDKVRTASISSPPYDNPMALRPGPPGRPIVLHIEEEKVGTWVAEGKFEPHTTWTMPGCDSWGAAQPSRPTNAPSKLLAQSFSGSFPAVG